MLYSSNSNVLDRVARFADELGQMDPPLELPDASLRWLAYHSQLSELAGSGIVLGASNVKQIKENMKDISVGPLSEQALRSVEQLKRDVEDAMTGNLDETEEKLRTTKNVSLRVWMESQRPARTSG